MIQIAFESAFDPFHAAFRILRQAVFLHDVSVDVSRAKILDVYVAEPSRCTDIRLPNSLKRAARDAASCQPPLYGRRPSINALFDRMSPMQDAAMQTLVLQGFLDADNFDHGKVMRTDQPLSGALSERIEKANKAQKDLMAFLLEDLKGIPFGGRNGLKDRTRLGEYRYDIV